MKQFFTLKNDYWWGLLWLTSLVIFFFLPVVLGQQRLFDVETTVYSTPSGQFYHLPGLKTGWRWGGISYIEAPQTIVALRMLKSGMLPLWSPYAAAGYPLAASLTSGIYYPLKFLVFTILPFFATFDFYFLLRFLVAGFGMFLYLKALRLSRGAALLGAVAYMFSGHLIVNIMNWWLNVVIVLPYTFFAFERYFITFKRKYLILAALFLALMILGGQPQTALIDSLLLFLYWIFRWWIHPERQVLRKKFIWFLVVSVTLAVLIALPMILDFSVFFMQGHNVHENDPQILKYYAPTQLLYFLISPTMFLELALFGRIPLAGTPIIFQYYSIVVWLLVWLGWCAVKKNKLHYFFSFYGLAVFLRYAGVSPFIWISRIFPFNKIFWLEHDNTLFFALAVLAALAYDKLRSGEVKLKKFLWGTLVLPAIFIGGALAAPEVFKYLYLPNFDLSIRRAGPLAAFSAFLAKLPAWLAQAVTAFFAEPRYFLVLLFGVVFGVWLATIYLVWRNVKRPTRMVRGALIGLLVLELFIYMPKIRDGGFKRFEPFPRHPAINFLEQKIGEEPVRFIGSKDVIPPQIPSVFGIEDFRTNEAIVLERYGEFARQFLFLVHYPDYKKLSPRSPDKPDIFISNTMGFDESDYTPALHHFFDLANITYIASEEPLIDPNLRLVFEKEGLKVYENTSVLPRAYVVHNIQRASTFQSAVPLLNDLNIQLGKSAVVDGIYPELDNLNKAEPGKSPVNIVSYSPLKISLTTTLTRPGLLVLSDAFYPGWRAKVDGKPVPIYPVNVMFRGIAMTEGSHLIEFEYWPWWVYLGFAVSGLTILSLFLVLYREQRYNK